MKKPAKRHYERRLEHAVAHGLEDLNRRVADGWKFSAVINGDPRYVLTFLVEKWRKRAVYSA